jgi:Arf-GAP/SH3 domain/ANK repeat/PH domain-containing protein
VKNDNINYEGRNKATAADEKHKSKKDRYTIARMDYFNALQDLAVFKESATLAILTHYVHSIHDIQVASANDLDGSSAALNELELQIDALFADIESRKLDIETKRRRTETSLAMERPSVIDAHQQFRNRRISSDFSRQEQPLLSPVSDPGPGPNTTEALALFSTSQSPPLIAVRPAVPPRASDLNRRRSTLDPLKSQLRRKEGFLWVNSRPITHQSNIESVKHWEKHWVVLAGGQLCEYADDKLELSGNPINLRFAAVREARTQDRRFTFEVITPSLRRVYQATSTEEAQAWLKTIGNVIQSLLDG